MNVHNPHNLPTIDYRAVKSLQGNLKNLTKINYGKLKHVLTKRGFTTPLFLWQSGDDFYLLDGHQRQRVMIKEDMQPYEVPYVLIEAKDTQDAKQQLLEITSQYGTITQEGFDEFAIDLPEAEIIEAVTFDALPLLGTHKQVDVEEDTPPEVEDIVGEPKSKRGEIYQLGEHKLLCGDATSPEDVKRLMNGERALLFATDPPYLVDYDGTNHPHAWNKKDNNVDHSDQYHDSEWDRSTNSELYKIFSGVAIDHAIAPNAAWYLWHAGTRADLVFDAWNAHNVLVHQQIVWVKDRPILTRSHYMYQHEPCYYGWIRGNQPPAVSRTHLYSVWNIKTLPPGQHNEHPTSKPIEVFAIPMEQHTRIGDICYEPFAGSGSQIIAAQQMGRRCYAIEISPVYCDVIRKRYAAFIGKEQEWETATPMIVTSPVS